MIDYEQLRAAIDRKLGTDPEFRTIMKRITEGRANFIDTARYSQVIAHTLGNELSKAVLELSDREAVTKQLLHDSYSDINDVFGRVQSAMDQKKGISLRQQIAPFPEERVDKFSHALVDPTVEDSVIKRRARAGSETITKSFHDDCIEVNAEFREEAGLKCYIERIGTDCCQWCTDVAGKYEMKDQPQGIFRRHDNCDCTIIYDGQVLRGEVGNNGRSSKKWAEVPKDAGAAEPVRLTKEQAAKIEAIHSLTMLAESDTIKERVGFDRGNNKLQSFGVAANTGSDLFSTEAKGKLLNREKEIANNRTETAFLFSPDGAELFQKDGDVSSVSFNSEELAMIKGGILTHNHPDSSSFSPKDISFLLINDVTELRACFSNGTYILQRTKKTIGRKPSADDVEKAFFEAYGIIGEKYQEIAARNGKNIWFYFRRIEEETIMSLSKMYGLNYRLEVVTNE